MDKEKQLKELTDIVHEGNYHEEETAEEIYNAGYRKQERAEWIYHECVSSYEGTISGYTCSKCCSFVDEDIFDRDEFGRSFCGRCGARMDGDNQ